MVKTISIPEDLHRELVYLKLENNKKNTAELVRSLIIAYKKQRFLEASNLFRQKLKESGKSFDEILKKSRKIREEIADEWFQ